MGFNNFRSCRPKALEKASSTTISEQVQPGTLSLSLLPSLSDGADAALTFQDWMEMSAAVMSDFASQAVPGGWV